METTVKSVRKIGMALAGAALLIVGLVMLVLPGPGIPAILGGLTLLAKEFRWAQRLLGRVKLATAALVGMLRRTFVKTATSLKRA
jgi:chromate transport protein ChrA